MVSASSSRAWRHKGQGMWVLLLLLLAVGVPQAVRKMMLLKTAAATRMCASSSSSWRQGRVMLVQLGQDTGELCHPLAGEGSCCCVCGNVRVVDSIGPCHAQIGSQQAPSKQQQAPV